MTSFAAAEREAVSAAEKAERKAQLRDKVSHFQCYIYQPCFLVLPYTGYVEIKDLRSRFYF